MMPSWMARSNPAWMRLGEPPFGSTPTVLIDGRKVDPGLGEWTPEKLSREIDAALKRRH